MLGARAMQWWVLCVAFATGLAAGWPEMAHAQARAPSPSAPGTDIGGSDEQPPAKATTIDPTLRILERAASRGAADGLLAARGTFDVDRVMVSIRFREAVGPDVIEALRVRGADVLGDTLGDHGLLRVSLPWSSLETVARLPGVRRIEALWQPRIDSPLEQTNQLIDATAARLHPPATVEGAGVRVGLIDTGIDVLHPALFRADAGYFSWLDVDGDGAFTPGTDAVDLDDDGIADRNETLDVLDATVIVDFEDGDVRNADGVFDTRRDWVYADMNGDGTRNAGTNAGFSEQTPGYGEATFVADDADRNGRLDPGEKLVRLGTSKIARYSTRDADYRRGEDLIAAAAESADAFHGTGVGGILVGGQQPFHDRVGVAPAADLYVYGLSATLQRDNRLPTDYLEAAVDDQVHVLLHEWTNSFTQPLDGSTNFEAAMSAARDEGLVHINPVGNLNLSQKHRIAEAGAGRETTLTFIVDEGFDGRSETLPYESAFGSLQWTGDHPGLTLELTTPGAESHRWSVAGTESVEVDGVRVDLAFEQTPRGNGYIEFYLESVATDAPLEQGEWSLSLTGFSGDDEVWARVTDEYSNWRPGIRWSEPTSGRGTAAFPATGDAAVGVGAYAGRDPVEGTGPDDHALRAFSGRGPRLDGRLVVDITAPDDPYVPLAATPEILGAGWGRSWYTVFGGTSGAAPHVAGTVALMLSRTDPMDPESVERRLTETARSSNLTPTPQQLPSAAWGYGRLDAYAAVYQTAAPTLGQAPSATLDLSVLDGVFQLDGSGSQHAGQLQYHFDSDYDGQWDGAWSEEAVATAEAPTQWSRLEVRDEVGLRHGAVSRWSAHADDAGHTGDGGTADAGADTGASPGPGGCCSQTSEGAIPAGWAWIWGLIATFLYRRRPRSGAA